MTENCASQLGFQPFNLEPQEPIGTVFEVTSAADSGPGTLRDVLENQIDSSEQSTPVATVQIKLPEGQNILALESEIRIHAPVIVDGSHSPAQVHISGQQKTRHFFLYPRRVVSFRDLVLEEGKAPMGADAEDPEGGGGSISTGSEVTFKGTNLIFRKNSCEGYGGGALRMARDATIHLTNVRFEENRFEANCERGGGAASFQNWSAAYLTNVTFENNHGINGGALNALGVYMEIRKSIFRNNSTRPGAEFPATDSSPKGTGGALYTDVNFDTRGEEMLIEDTLFEGNEGYGNGGGFFLFTKGDQARLRRVHFLRNRVLPEKREGGSAKGLGGGLNVRQGQYVLEDCSFVENTAALEGGGIWLGRKDFTSLEMHRVYLKGNQAEHCGGGMTLYADSQLTDVLLVDNHCPNGSSFCTNPDPAHQPTLSFSHVALVQQGTEFGPQVNTGLSEGSSVVMLPLHDTSSGEKLLVPNLSNGENTKVALKNEEQFCPYWSRKVLLDDSIFASSP